MSKFLGLCLPCVLWLFLMRDFVLGTIPVNMDTNTIYGVTKFYFNNLLNGVIPLWEPFVALGRPFYALAICNLFNPIAQIIPLLKIVGINYAQGFVIYMVVYFFLGCVGFYWLSLEILKDKYISFLAYVSLMFSSFGASMFTQFTFLEIVVPAIWFFFFLLRFYRETSRANFIGLGFTAMVLISSYLPFYFVTVFLCFLLSAVVFYFKETKNFFVKVAQFLVKNWRLALFCILGIVAAAGPLLAYKMLDGSGEVVAPGRHCEYSSAQQCYERTMADQGGMLFDEITRSGTLGERMDMQYLFGNLDKITYGSDSLFFLPVMVFILIGVALFLPLTRLTMLLSVSSVLIGLIASGNASWLFGFLYRHFFIFTYFRNLFFLGAFLVPMVILLAMHQLQMLLDLNAKTIAQKKATLVIVAVLHIAMVVFLKHFRGVGAISFVTVLLSAMAFFIYYLTENKFSRRIWTGVFLMILLLQPIWVLKNYAAHASEFATTLPSMHVKPVFSWERPLVPAANKSRIYQFVPYEDFWYDMSMTDAPPVVAYPQSATRWTFDLSQHVAPQALANYARYKIVLYDDSSPVAIPVEAASQEISVDAFDVNTLKLHLNFSKPKLLVYNDSYTSSWKAFLDGRPTELLIANQAFKGIRVPAGEHRIEFSYHPPGGTWVYITATLTLLFFFFLTIYAIRYA